MRFLMRRCRGNPFLIRQFCSLLLERGSITIGPSRTAELLEEPESIPAEVDEVMAARIDGLPRDRREAVVSAAVLGTEFSPDVLAAMLGRELDSDLRPDLEAGGFWTVSEGRAWSFRHGLIRDSVYRMQLGSKKRGLHLAAAEALSAVRDGDPESEGEVARHLELGGRPGSAWPHYEAAGDRARASSLPEEALEHYTAMERCLDGGSTSDLLRARGKRCVPLEVLGRLDRAREIYGESIALAEESGERGHLARMLLSAGRLNCIRGELDRAEAQLKRSLALFGEIGDEDMVSRVYSNLGMFHLRRGDARRADEYSRRFLEAARRLGNRQHQCMAEGLVAVTAQRLGDLKEALERNRAQLDLARELGLKECESTALTNLGSVYSEMGEHARARECFLEDYRLVRSAGLLVDSITALANLADVRREEGDLDEAERLSREALDIAVSIGHTFRQCSSMVALSLLLSERGETGEAGRLAERALAMARGNGYETLKAEAGRALERAR
jgi:predicted ATPase